LVFAIECIANQNARDRGAAQSPCAQIETLEILLEHDVGIAQIPCPEMACLGFARARPAGTSISAALLRPEAQARCRRLVHHTIERLQGYRDHGVQVVAILGGNAASPACAVHGSGDPLWPAALSKDSGIFMQGLAGAMAERAIDVPFRGIRDAEAGALADDLSWLRARVSR
jgi:predicted secreted protein